MQDDVRPPYLKRETDFRRVQVATSPAMAPAGAPQPLPPPPQAQNVQPPLKPRKRTWRIVLPLLVLVLIGGGVFMFLKPAKTKSASDQQPIQEVNVTVPAPVQGLQLQQNKNYGNKYSDGILPVGDGKYVTDAPKTGYVYACAGYATNIKKDSGGASKRGPWFVNNNASYDLNKKLHVQGSVMWQAQFSNKLVGNNRTIVTNDLPNHLTGVFPLSPKDPAYAYDRNPNSIKGQTMTYALKANPTYGNPSCMGGQVGIMLTGVTLFNGFDAGGRDAGAWEVQDSCDGHPEKDGIYHYHTLSSCVKDISVKTVIGFALDGFPITGPKVADSNILMTSDLDECHGLTSKIVLDGSEVTMYHYVMTQDFPYSVSCFRGQAIQPPGQPAA